MQFPHAGQTFQGKYKLLEVLGRGGFAAVYKAIDIDVGREVAIKLLMPSEDGYDSSVVARFQREARIIAQLKDPHTITMFDFGRTEDGLLYMVFEYVAGADLAHRLADTGPLPPAIVVHVLDQLLQALREAHEAGVLHRDIKPANVLVFPYLDDDWRVKLLDFGIAKPGIGANADPVATLTRAGGIIGTPRYMSPEQLCGEELAATTDIYSLGLVAYEMLVGSPAISGRDTRDNIVLQLSTDPLVIPARLNVPQHLRRLIERMMARDAERRFQTAREVIMALRGSASGPQAGPYGSISTPTHTTGPMRRIPTGPHHQPGSGSGPSEGLAGHSSSVEFVPRQRTTGSHGQMSEAPGDRRLSPATVLAIGVALGVLIVVPIMLIATHDRDDSQAPELTRELTKTTKASSTTTPHPTPTEPPTPDTAVDAGAGERAKPDVRLSARSGCGVSAEKTGFVSDTVDFGLGARGLVTYIPRNYDPERKHPVVLVFHDRTRDPKQAITDMKLAPLADEAGFIVVAPGGRDYNAPWSPHGDVAFLEKILADVQEQYCVDPTRRYAIGHNLGGAAVEEFACLVEFSAIATTAHRGTDRLPCDYSPAVPHIHLVGNRDRYHPIGGGSTCALGTVVPLETKEANWKQQNGCSGKRRTYFKVDTGVCETFEDCEVPFVSCIMNGGRDWPESAPRGIQLPGCVREPSQFPIHKTVWDFFAKHGRELTVPE